MHVLAYIAMLLFICLGVIFSPFINIILPETDDYVRLVKENGFVLTVLRYLDNYPFINVHRCDQTIHLDTFVSRMICL